MERASRELCENDTWILVQNAASIQLVGTVGSFVSGSVGEGEFTVESDRAKLVPVMRAIVKRKLELALRDGDLPSYRRHLNLQPVHLRGFPVEPIPGLVPDLDCDSGTAGSDKVVAQFLHQNGFTGVRRRDAAGWGPLHYAALSGSAPLLQGLLSQRADPNRRTSKDEPKLGFPPWVSALDLALFYRQKP